jgi:hypothetical protein
MASLLQVLLEVQVLWKFFWVLIGNIGRNRLQCTGRGRDEVQAILRDANRLETPADQAAPLI